MLMGILFWPFKLIWAIIKACGTILGIIVTIAIICLVGVLCITTAWMLPVLIVLAFIYFLFN